MMRTRALIAIILLTIALGVLMQCVSNKPQVKLQNEYQPTKTYRVFLPFVTHRACQTNPKRGLAHTWGKCQDVASVCATWQYVWYYRPPDCGVESVPMVRDAQQQAALRANGWRLGGNSAWVLGYNEPDLCPDQACITPTQAALLWHELEDALADHQLVAPVPSHVHPAWIVEFRDLYFARYGKLPRLNALAMHWYGQRASDAIALTEWYKARATEWGIAEIWVTEFAFFACTNLSLAEAGEEARAYIDYLNDEPLVTRYAWFTNRTRQDENYVGAYAECSASPLFDWTTGKPTFWRDVYAR